MQNILDKVAAPFRNAIVFFVIYLLFLIPTYYLPYAGSNSSVINALGAAVGAGLSPQFWAHVAALFVLVITTWLRGCAIGKQWIVVFPLIAAVFDMTPGLSIIPLIPTAMHVIALIMGARGATTAVPMTHVPMVGAIFACAAGAVIVSGLMYSWTWQSRVNQPAADLVAKPKVNRPETPSQNPSPSPATNLPTNQTKSGKKPPIQEWLGRWEGVEETSMELSQRPDGDLLVKINTLDGEMSVRGVVKGEVVEFYHLGQRKTIRFGNGEDTGMKWLADKTECLILAEGEGYCRK